MTIIKTVTAIVIALAAFFGAHSAYNGLYNFERAEVIGTVYAPDAAYFQTRQLALVDGKLAVTTCSAEKLASLSKYGYDQCFDTRYVGDADVLVKSVWSHKAQVRSAMNHSMVMYALELRDGLVTQ